MSSSETFASAAGMLRDSTRSATEIARELTRVFESSLFQRTGVEAEPDPILATMFHAFATQIARVYEEAEREFPATVLDDLINVLGITPRSARPAQTVVCFTGVDERERLSPWIELRGYSQSGEQIGFSPDASIELSSTSLAFAGLYEGGRLHSLRGARVGRGGPPVPVGSVPCSLGHRGPTLFLALRGDSSHLSGLGLHLDLQPPTGELAQAFHRAPWQILSDGLVVEEGVLRTLEGPGGVRQLSFPSDRLSDRAAVPELPEFSDEVDEGVLEAFLSVRSGIYGGSVFVFPPIPKDRRFTSNVPAFLEDSVRRLLPPEKPDALDLPLIWVQVPLPVDVTGVVEGLHRVTLHAVSASNVEVFNERLSFGRSGDVVALEPEGRRSRHLMGVLSVVGESGVPYVRESDVHAPVSRGRYRHRSQRLETRAGLTKTGRRDAYAMVRLLYCDGESANGLKPGDLKQISSSLRNVTAQVKNLTVTRGGAAPPEYVEGRRRFADHLRNRERVVTAADVESAVLSFEPRVRGVTAEAIPRVGTAGTLNGNRVVVELPAEAFSDPDAEVARLETGLTNHLQSRAMLGVQFGVEVVLV